MLDSNFQRVVLTLLSDLGGDISDQVQRLVKTGDIHGLSTIRLDPSSYEDPELFFRDYQAVELLRKVQLPGDVNRLTQAAVETFFICEKQCARTNLRLNRFIHSVFDDADELTIRDFVSDCKNWIKKVLGALPLDLNVKFGPGATYSDKGSLTTIPDKMTSRPTASADALCLRPLLEDTAWFRALYSRGNSICHPEIVPGNRFTTVPKDLTKRRGICIEPSINVALQLAVGSEMKARLKRVGLDLKNGQEVHRNLARQASLDGSLATIDLSNASDTISRRFVEILLPKNWFELLDALRSKKTLVDGKWYYLEKFSSMGNGFTFELETLLFAAIAHACGGQIGEDTFIYGDDIIAPVAVANDIVAALKYFGFVTNPKKTFLSGPFRESCGGDFFLGVAVRPHYIKEVPNEPQDWIKLVNGLRRVGYSNTHSVLRWYRLRRAWLRALDNIPAHIRRLRGPIELGDLVIHDDVIPRKWRNGIGYVKVYRPVAKPLPWHHWTDDVKLASALYGVPSEGPIPRDNVAGYKVGWVAFS